MDVIDLIKKCAEIPSFSTQENKLHPFLEDTSNKIEGSELIHTPDNNIIITVPGDRDCSPVALTAHLDKIDHFKGKNPEKLKVKTTSKKIIGQLDDSSGIGVCLYMAKISKKNCFPPLYLLFSEMEESLPPHIQTNTNLHSGLGAERISKYLIENNQLPAAVITIDTTPFFRRKNGIALYSRFWEKCGLHASSSLIDLTTKIEQYFLLKYPEIKHRNNINDYITYGKILNTKIKKPIPSIALEPAIFPYHKIGEAVFIKDIKMIVDMLTDFLENFTF